MRSLLVMASSLLASAALAYQPTSHITRGIYCNVSPLLSSTHWGRYGDGFEFGSAAHTGAAGLKVSVSDAAGRGAGAAQVVKLQQAEPQPIKIAGWCKTENVADGPRDYRCSVYVDFIHADGTPLHMQIAAFSGGTHDWEYSETVVKPEKPLAEARVYVFLRQRTGAAIFDDIFIGAPDGPNLLKNPGFEPEDREDSTVRDAIYNTYRDLNANAIHSYLSGAPSFWQGPDGKGNEQVREFLKVAQERGLGVWLTTGHPPEPTIKDANDPNFPQYLCVNGPWGQAWTETLRLAAGYEFAGISLVPDEYNWTNWPLKERYTKHSDPKVAEFYESLAAMCNCPVCAALYQKTYSEPLPPLAAGMNFPEQTPPYLRYLRQRYDSTTRWIGNSVRAIKAVNPKVRADSLICVSPICSDMWWGTGVAWDRIGYETDIDFPTTDPYIELHNYLGDSTHWYVTETAAHLTASTPKRQCGIVLEASRLRQEYRELDPVEIYGSALSAVAHGAKELAWWHYDHLTDRSKTTDRADISRACVRGVYGLLQQADPWLGGLHTPQRIACLHSRASDDLWRFYTQPQPSPVLTHAVDDPRYAAVAQKEVLYYLFRRGIPADLYYLEAVQEQQLHPYSTIIVPFAFAISDKQAALLRKLAESGKSVIVISEVGVLDDLGLPRAKPALLDLCGLAQAPRDGEPLARTASARRLPTRAGLPEGLPCQTGKGRVFFLPAAFGYGLPLHRDNQKRTRQERITPDPLSPERMAVLDGVLEQACGAEPWVLRQMPERDVEATYLLNAKGDPVLLVTNWEGEPVAVDVQLPVTCPRTFTGFRLGPDGTRKASAIKGEARAGVIRFSLKLSPREACLWRGVR